MKQVTLYSTATCGFCKLAKAFLTEHQVPYTEHDVGLDAARAQEMISKSGQMGVPVIDVAGKIIIGFDRTALTEALGLTP